MFAVRPNGAMDVSHLLLPECILPWMFSMFFFFALKTIAFKYVVPRFKHIQNNVALQEKVAFILVAVVHGILVAYGSMIFLYPTISFTATEETCAFKTSAMQRMWFSFSIGYFCYDLMDVWNSPKYIIHHSVCTACLVMGIVGVHGGSFPYMTVLTFDWNNWLLHLRSLSAYSARDRKEYSTLSLNFKLLSVYFASFVILRFGIWSRMVWGIALVQSCPSYLLITAAMLLVVNVLLFVVLLKDLRRIYGELRGARGKGKTSSNKLRSKSVRL